MTKLREDLRSAFEREQVALGDVGDARHRLMRNALSPRDVPSSRGLQWAAGIAAVLIAAIVIATFAIAKANSHSRVVPAASPSPKAQASPTPLANQLVVPSGTPVILYHDPVDFDQVDGMTWNGKTSGRVGAGVSMGGAGSPDGSKFTTSADKALAGSFWADDSIHHCLVVRTTSSDKTGPGMLQITGPGEAPRNIVKVGTIAWSGSNAGGPNVIACSPAADRAVVYQSGGQGTGVVEFWVIQLSTGRTIWHGGSGAYIAASHDGTYVAVAPALRQPTVIYGPRGAVAGRVAATVFTFSWDARLAVVGTDFGNTPRLVDWRTDQTIWTCPGDAAYNWSQSFAEPGGQLMAIGAANPAYRDNGFQPVDLFVVGPNGVVVLEKKDVTLIQY